MKKIVLACGCGFLIVISMLCGCSSANINTAGKNVIVSDSPTANIASTAAPTQAPDFDFRNTYWGMTQDEVIASETEDLVEQSDEWLAYYSTDVAGMSSDIGYKFESNSLVAAIYAFDEEHTNENDYINDFSDLKEALTSVYGTPSIDTITWKNDLYKDDPQDYGFAVSCGHLVYVASWKTPTTEISLVLHGDNFDISLGIRYQSIGFVDGVDDNGL